mgnify:CR=1 FL=1
MKIVSIQPDVVLAACPACGNPTVKLDHVQKCVNDLKAKLVKVKEAFQAEIGKMPCDSEPGSTDECAGGGYHGCMGCDARAKRALAL